MSLYRRPDSPYWWYSFIRDGVRYSGSTKKTARREARNVERQEQRRVERGEVRAPTTDTATLNDLLERYYEDHASHLPSEDTISYYIQALQDGLDQKIAIADLSNQHIAEYVATRRKSVSSATVNRELATLRSAHRMAGEDWEWTVKPIAWRRHMLKEPQGRTRHITRKQALALLAALPEHSAHICEFALLTGCRKSEILGLRWEHVDLHQRAVRVFGKGQRWREVHLSGEAWLLLAHMPPTDPLNPTADRAGPVFDGTNLRRYWAAACNAAKITDFRIHDLRHTFATWLRQGGAALEIVQEALGHSDIGVTRRYAHVERQEVAKAVDALQLRPEVSTKSSTLKDAKG